MKSSELIKRFQRGGWVEIRQSGSHKVFKHPEKLLSISVPAHGSKEVQQDWQKKYLSRRG